VMGYAEILKMKYKDPEKGSGKAADIIFKGSQRAANLTKQLLGFARGGKYNPEPANVNYIIRDTVSVSEKIFEKNIDLRFDFEENVNTIEADKNQLGQVITNLIINAKDAMPSGGELTLSTENAFLDKDYVYKYPEIIMGNYVKISVTDNGIGMVKEVKDRIFEPFFTTKGKGTGLGLATVYGIIKNHKGHINCYSEPGEGTTFNIYLPVTDGEIIQKNDKQKILTGNEKILVIDDEENLRKLLFDQLEDLGYKVVLAADGVEAVDIYKNELNEIDLVLLDMIIPGMPSRKTFDSLKKLNPDVKVLLISGYSQNGKAKRILNEGAMGFLQKPFNLQQLSEKIHEMLKS
ncbi:ATP-binding protein, partial [candidate division KSB1 bacterium]